MMVFKSGSIEKFLMVFINEGADELPQHIIVEKIGSGAYYYSVEHLKKLGLLEETRCFSEEKKMEVKCIKLTKEGKEVLQYLKKIRAITLKETYQA